MTSSSYAPPGLSLPGSVVQGDDGPLTCLQPSDRLIDQSPGFLLQQQPFRRVFVPLLDAIISVHDVMVFKPSPRVYALASSRLGAPPREIGFVSSNSWDVNGAASTGLTAFWIQRSPGEPPEELGYAAAATVRAITDLPGLVTA